MIEAADEFVDEFQLNRIFYHWSRSVPSKKMVAGYLNAISGAVII